VARVLDRSGTFEPSSYSTCRSAREVSADSTDLMNVGQLRPDDAVLEIGSGHGDTLAKAANTASRGFLCGIDFSTVMHAHAMRRHRRLVAEKRIEFRLGSSDRLPFDDQSFDKVFAVHTIYFGKRRSIISPKPAGC
jgi:ubiquinone/menaquinone biosynthesis C-methylase UbiE